MLEALGIDLREPFSPEEMNYCCGGGGGVLDNERAAPLRYKRVRPQARQVEATGRGHFVTTCATCRVQFERGAHFKWDNSP